MIVRPLSILSLLLLLSLVATTQVYVCDFGSTHPHVLVKNIVFKAPIQLSWSSQQALRDSILRLSRQTHSLQWADVLPEDANELVTEAYQNDGFFKASTEAELRRVADRGDLHAVNLIFRVVPGDQYRLGPTVWKGNSAVSAGELNEVFGIQVGQTFRRKRIAEGLEAVTNLYTSHGYINSTTVPYPTVDEARKVVSFEMNIDEGKQFRFGELATHGIEDQHRQILLPAWSKLRGKTYNPKQADEFFRHFFKPLRAGISPKDYTQRRINESGGTVDYSLSLTRDRALDTAIRR